MWPVVNPGDLRHWITWQRKIVSGQDGFGQDVYQWTDIFTCYAQVIMLGGQEMQAAQQRWPEARYRIRQHYSPGLKPSDRVVWFIDLENSRYLDVLDVTDPQGMQVINEAMAKEWLP